jgi:hypothetical protein
MARPKVDAELQVRTSFEASRTAAECLAAAYERLVPIPCRPIRTDARLESRPPSVLAPMMPRRRSGERG